MSEMINNRDPWELMFRASLHLRSQMTLARLNYTVFADIHDAFNLIHEKCLPAILEERKKMWHPLAYPKSAS